MCDRISEFIEAAVHEMMFGVIAAVDVETPARVDEDTVAAIG